MTGPSAEPARQHAGEDPPRDRTRGRLLPCRLLADLPNWVGDVIMALPAIHRLLQANRGGQTVLHPRPSVRRLLELMLPECEVKVSPRRASPFSTALRLCQDGGRYQVGVTMRHASRAKLLLRFAARHTLGSSGGGAALLLSRSFRVDRRRHQVHDTDAILQALGLDPVDPLYKPDLPPQLADEGAQALDEAGVLGRRLIGLAPSARWGPSKLWPAGRYGALAQRLLGEGLQPVILIGPGESTFAEDVRQAAGSAIPAVGEEIDVAGLAGIMTHLEALACNDSGPMHLAAMVGTPVVALFGPTDPVRTRPLGVGHVVLSRKLHCSPCMEPRCPLEHHGCLRELDEQLVLDALLQLIS
jgi:lipopolysaccharide heptosyltransferase II